MVTNAMPSISKFPLGTICATPTALEPLEVIETHFALSRHVSGDWGILFDEDNQALVNGRSPVFGISFRSGRKILCNHRVG